MKKTPTPPDDMWGRDLFTFDAALRARGMAEQTRRAYSLDLGQLAEWARRHELGALRQRFAKRARRQGAVQDAHLDER